MIRFDPEEGFLTNYAEHERLIKELRAGRDCVVVEVYYCLERFRRMIETEINLFAPGAVIEYRCFENDLARANENCRKRPDKRDPKDHVLLNEQISPQYKCPEGASVEKIFAL